MRRMITLLLLVGGLNSGFIGLFGLNPVEALLDGGVLSRLFYLLIGLAACGRLLLGKRARQRRLNIGPIGSSNL